jgi:hypothetical protein
MREKTEFDRAAPALHLPHETGGPRNDPKETDQQPAGEHATPYVRGSRRKPLKRLDSRMESEGFRIWILFRRTLILFRSGFDFVPTHFEFDPRVLKVGADPLRRCGVGQNVALGLAPYTLGVGAGFA